MGKLDKLVGRELIKLVVYRWVQKWFVSVFSVILNVDTIENITKKTEEHKGIAVGWLLIFME